jgi:hypothetical protein
MGDSRPSLGFEYEIALAKIDRTVALSFDEYDPHPAIVGGFEVITCTKDARCVPPVTQFQPLVCGYLPAAQIIPAPGVPGTLSFEGLDKAADNRPMAYHGELCVARVIARLEEVIVRTMYCSYFTPKIEIRAPDGEEPGRVSGEGAFTVISFDPPIT